MVVHVLITVPILAVEMVVLLAQEPVLELVLIPAAKTVAPLVQELAQVTVVLQLVLLVRIHVITLVKEHVKPIATMLVLPQK